MTSFLIEGFRLIRPKYCDAPRSALVQLPRVLVVRGLLRGRTLVVIRIFAACTKNPKYRWAPPALEFSSTRPQSMSVSRTIFD